MLSNPTTGVTPVEATAQTTQKTTARGKSRNRTILSSPFGADEATTKKKKLLG